MKFTILKCLPEVAKRSRTTRAIRNQSPIKEEIEKVINKDILNLVEKPALHVRHKSYAKLPNLKKVFDPSDKPTIKDQMVECPVC